MQVVKGQLYKERNQLRMMLDRIALIPEVDDRYQPAAEECLADGVESLAEETRAALTQLAEYHAQVTALTDSLNKAEQRICELLTRNTHLKTTVRALFTVTTPATARQLSHDVDTH
jgi:phage shock protein A